MLNFDLLKNLLVVALASSIITTALVQRIKESFNFSNSSFLVIVSFIVSMTLGTLFSLSFSDANIIDSLWVGLISFLEADMIYKMFEDKIFTPYNKINDKNIVEIPKENEIR